jgi:hypothetical protein
VRTNARCEVGRIHLDEVPFSMLWHAEHDEVTPHVA